MTAQIKRPKGQKTDWPKVVQVGSVAVKVYRTKHATNASGFSHVVAWKDASGRKLSTFADEGDALNEARTKAAQLAAGRVEGAEMSRGDRDELQALRALARDRIGGRPLLSIFEEYAKAFELTAGRVVESAQAFAAKHSTEFKRLRLPDAVNEFIAAKEKAGKAGERTYRAKLKPAAEYFGGDEAKGEPARFLDEVTAGEWTDFLGQWDDGVTRNDIRKRVVALCIWARDVRKALPRGVPTEAELTERAPENATDIGVLTAPEWRKVLRWIHGNRPDLLAPVVVAGFCGVRSDEIHGKRGDRDRAAKDAAHVVRRQTWEDIDLEGAHLNVTNAKRNTPAWRLVPLCPAALAWFKLCPGERTGPICEPGAMEDVRRVLIEAGFNLPENCFRHSFITYKVAETGNKARVAEWAGNSVKEIDKRYRRPATQAAGVAWAESAPGVT